MEGYSLLLLGFLIIGSKIFSHFFSKWNLPPILAMILIGILIGPSLMNLLPLPVNGAGGEDYVRMKFLADIGVIFLLFLAGVETDMEQMRKVGLNALLIASGGITLSFILGFSVGYLFTGDMLLSILLGILLVSTSVSVSVMSLMELKKIQTVEATTIIGAAIMDDIIGLVVVTIFIGFLGASGSEGSSMLMTSLGILGKIFAFFVVSALMGIFVIPPAISWANRLNTTTPMISLCLGFIFIFAWAAPQVEVASIVGAYLVGLFIGQTKFKSKVGEEINTIAQALFICLFFVFVGVETNLRSGKIDLLFSLFFLLAAVFGKVFGNGLVARLTGFDWRRSMRVGFGMIPRGEVTLIIAGLVSTADTPLKKAFHSSHFFASVFVVIGTAVVTPLLLKSAFKD